MNKIKIVPADFQKAMAELQRIEALLNDYRTELASKYSMMANDWRGVAGGAFDDCGHKVISAFEANISDLRQLATDIEQACQYFEEADRQISGVINNA